MSSLFFAAMFEYANVTFSEEALQFRIGTMCSVIICILIIVIINSDIDIILL